MFETDDAVGDFIFSTYIYIRINSNEIINHPITFVDWSNNSKHPVAFNTIVKDVIEMCRKNKIFFARKFVHMPLSVEDIEYLLELQKPSDNVDITPDIDLEPIIEDKEDDVEDIIPTNDESVVYTTTTPITRLDVTEKQKDAVLNFFKDVLNNLSSGRIHTIYSALFVDDIKEENENILLEPTIDYSENTDNTDNTDNVINTIHDEIIYNPLDILTLAIETIENTEESLEAGVEELEENDAENVL
jgi:hypothetical protein